MEAAACSREMNRITSANPEMWEFETVRIMGVLERRLDPCMSEVFPWSDIPAAHMKMLRNEHKPGNMAVLVSAPGPGYRTFEDAVEATRALGRKTHLLGCFGPPSRAIFRMRARAGRAGAGGTLRGARLCLPVRARWGICHPGWVARAR